MRLPRSADITGSCTTGLPLPHAAARLLDEGARPARPADKPEPGTAGISLGVDGVSHNRAASKSPSRLLVGIDPARRAPDRIDTDTRCEAPGRPGIDLSLIHISEPT